MPLIQVKVRHEGAVPGSMNLSRGAFDNCLKEAWFETGKFWHTALRPKHFTKSGAREYGYLPRKGEESGAGRSFWKSYTGRKQKKFGHTLPLVFTGELREMSGTANIQPTAKGVRVALSRANKANWHNPHSQIDMREELTRVSDAEARLLAEVPDEAMQKMLDHINAHYQTNPTPTTSVAGFFHGD